MGRPDIDFQERVQRNLEIAARLQKEPWVIAELDRDPVVLAALVAHFADHNAERMIGGVQPSSIRQAIQSLFDSEINRRSGRSMALVSWAGFFVGVAGLALAAVEVWLTANLR